MCIHIAYIFSYFLRLVNENDDSCETENAELKQRTVLWSTLCHHDLCGFKKYIKQHGEEGNTHKK